MRMKGITLFFDNLFAQYAKADFSLLFLIDVCAFAFVFLAALFCCIFSQRARACKKTAFLYLTELFSLVTLTVFLSRFTPAQSLAFTAIFNCAGIIFYGVLCSFKSSQKEEGSSGRGEYVQSSAPVRTPVLQPEIKSVPAVQTGVRLDHALSIADKLLIKNVGRGDRQELEKIKTALTVLKVKGALTPQEGENLNDIFNTLLKLMAKYDL